ncbi:HAD-IA family hydrolase [Streptomyces sp. NPDC088387]|uniref:HAD-IA family hydrolase n=1 Tax=Streptomyces sp. NPDC088387 TaxID=3365859 RepID=UPI00380C2413
MVTSAWSGSAVLFDLDGTLIESMPTIERHTRLWAARHGLDPEHTLEIWHGRRDSDVIAELVGAGLVEAELAWMRDISCRDVAGITALPGAAGLLGLLPPRSWGIVTSGERDVARARLAAAGLPVPDVLVSADDVTKGKPDPEGYLRGARLLAVDPADCLVVEDAATGIDAALSAGMYAVLLAGEPADSPAALRLSTLLHMEVEPSSAPLVRLRFEPAGSLPAAGRLLETAGPARRGGGAPVPRQDLEAVGSGRAAS